MGDKYERKGIWKEEEEWGGGTMKVKRHSEEREEERRDGEMVYERKSYRTTLNVTHQHSVEVEVLRCFRVVATLVLELGTGIHQIHHLWLELCVYICVCVCMSMCV